MRVLIATSSFARWPGGDPLAAHGNALYELIAELGERIEGTVITHAGPGAAPEERLGGLLVKRVPPERPEAALHKALVGPGAWRVLAAARAMKREVERDAPFHDVAHAYWFYPGGRSIQKLKMPRVITFPGPDIHLFPRYPVLGGAIKRTARAVDVCVSVDTLGAEILREVQPKRVEYIPSPIRLDSFPLAPQVSAPRLLYVGRLAGEKGVDLLLEAMAILRTDIGEVSLEVVGDGPERASLEQLSRSLGLDDRVVFSGAQPQSEVAEAIRRARALVLPSRREGLPSAALEALSSGRPVVATAVGGLPELIGDAFGRIAPVGDASAFAKAVEEALLADWDSEALRGRAEGFSVTRAADSYVDLYRDLAAEYQSG